MGTPNATTATARKLAILVYRRLNGPLAYRDPGADTYNAVDAPACCAASDDAPDALGFTLVSRETREMLGGAVS